MDRLTRHFARTSQVLRLEAERRMTAAGGTMPEWLLLTSAVNEPDLSQRELSSRLGLEPNTLTHHLERMAADGLVRRSRDPKDKRVLRVRVTAKGRRRAAALDAALQAFEDDLSGVLSEREAATLRRLLARVHDHFHPEGPPSHPWPPAGTG